MLWLTENYPPQRGGMAQSCDRIINGLRKSGHTIHIIHLYQGSRPYQRKTEQNGSYTSIPFEDSEAHTLNRLYIFLRQQYTSIGFLVCFGGYLPLLAAPVYKKWLNVKLVTMFRGNDFDLGIFTPRKRGYIEDAIIEANLVISVSKKKSEQIELLIPNRQVQYVPNGIDLDEWQPMQSEISFAHRWREENVKKEELVFGIFGQLKAKKGVNFFLETVHLKKLTDRIKFLFVGELNEASKTELTDKNINYVHLEFLDHFELMKYYLTCDAVAIPSFYDGMPNVLLESAALGIPVITSDVDGMYDLLAPLDYPFMFRAGDIEDCGKKVFDYLQLPKEKRASLGELLKTTIKTNYTKEMETEKLSELLTNII